jgi:hypothetical protein
MESKTVATMEGNNFTRLGLILSNLGKEIQQNANNLTNVTDLRNELINRMDQMSLQINLNAERLQTVVANTERLQAVVANTERLQTAVANIAEENRINGNNIFQLQHSLVSLENRMMVRYMNSYNILGTSRIEYINVIEN